MIKLPLRVITRHPSQKDQLLAEAITLRSDREMVAIAEGQKTCEYLRPILLLQAERVDACETLRERMFAESAFQRFLLPASPLTVSPERAVNFKTMDYEPSWRYEGGFQFKKHYFGSKPGELLEATPSGELKEEFKCAQFLDALPKVAFWVRNLANKATSFRLQTSGNWFYPDFICQLTDGRVLVVEYKGEHLFAEAGEKRAVGAVWESRSGGKCLFVMPEGPDMAAIERKIRGTG